MKKLQEASFTLLPLALTGILNLSFLVVGGSPSYGASTEIFAQPQWREPVFTEEPESRIEFLNDRGAAIVCRAGGFPHPQITWVGSDNRILSDIDNFRTILPNSTLFIHPFKPASYRQDVHSTSVRCKAGNSVGSIISRDIHVRAVISQHWGVKVVSSPPHLSPRAGPVLLNCEVDLMGGGRDLIEVTGWKRDGKFITKRSPRFYESDEDEVLLSWHILPNGDLVIESLQESDVNVKVGCLTRHKITLQEIPSPPLTITFSEKTSHADASNIAESFPSPLLVNEGNSIVLHCPVLLTPSSEGDAKVRWEKLSGTSWVQVPSLGTPPKFLRQVGNSLVSQKSTKGHSGHYRCVSSGRREKISEFEIRVTSPLTVRLTINQAKSQLQSTAELTCTTSQTSLSIIWLRDANLINPGTRIRFFTTNVLQINQIEQSDQGVYQCLARTEDGQSAQASVRLELADAEPRISLSSSFQEQSLAPGPSITLRCAFTGSPSPSITWFLENWPLPLSYDARILIGNITSHGHMISFLNITQTRVEDGGLYRCVAKNRAGSVSHSARLNIYGPPWIRVVPPLVAISGESLTINCPISGWPISFASITWEKDGQKLPLNRQRVGSNGSLTILADKSEGATQEYWCSISDAMGRRITRMISLSVHAPLRISESSFPESGKVVEGERITLVCSLSSGDPPIQISWNMLPSDPDSHSRTPRRFPSFPKNESQDLEGDGRKSSSVSAGDPPFSVLNTDPFTSLLSIPKVSEKHSGKFTCNASSAEQNVVKSHVLTVLVPPKIEAFAFQEALKEKMMTRLVCGVSQGDLPIEFTWFKDNQRLSLSSPNDESWTKAIEISTLDSFSTLLRFNSLSEAASGVYTCLVKNPCCQAHFSAKLLVQVPPRWVKQPEDLNVTLGDESEFGCSAYGVPQPMVNWFKSTGDGNGDGKWRPVETIWPSTAGQAISLQNGSLIFYSVEESHSGAYLCSISNGIGSGLSKNVHLNVQVPPYFVGGESQPISLTQGKTHEISCESISSSPIYLTWSKGNVPFVSVAANRIHTFVKMEGKKTKSTLVIKDVTSEDGGKYRCVAENAFGKVSRSYFLEVEEQPGSPTSLRLAGESLRNGPEATRVYVEWDPPKEYSSKSRGVPGESPRPAFPPILSYVLEFSPISEEKMPFSRQLEVPGEKTLAKVENLTPGAVYNIKVKAVNAAGSSSPSEPLIFRTAFTPPTAWPMNARASPSDQGTSIFLSWTPLPVEMTFGRIVAYRIILTPDSSLGVSTTILLPTTAAYRNFRNNNATVNEEKTVIHGLAPFTLYSLRIRALNIAGEGPLSPPFSIRTAEEAPFLPPRNPQCLSITSASIQVSWQHPLQPNGPINLYKVHFHPVDWDASSSKNEIEVHKATTGLTTVISGLQPSTNYSFQIFPINNIGPGPWVHLFCKTTEDVPSAPSNLIGFPTTSSIYLTWLLPRKPNGILTHHTIYFRMIDKASDSFEVKRTVAGNLDYYEESGLDLSRFKYVFWVTSSTRVGESQPSSQLIFTPPPLVETRLVGQSKKVRVRQGNPLSLRCRLLGLDLLESPVSSPDLAVTWTENGKRLGFDGNVYMKPGSSDLFFFSVSSNYEGNYTCRFKNGIIRKAKTLTTKKVINGMEAQSLQDQQLTYSLEVKAAACPPQPSYRVLGRDIFVAWTVDEYQRGCDAPVGFILLYRTMGSILDWKRIVFQSSARNYTLKGITCGSILNLYVVGFNEVGNSPDSHLMSVVVSHSVAPFPPPQDIIVSNVSSVLLNLYPLNTNASHCPVDTFSVALRETQSSQWFSGKDVKIQFRNEYAIEGLKSSTHYEIAITIFGYSTSRSATFTFSTLSEIGEVLSTDILGARGVTNEFSLLYNNLTLILPTALALMAIFGAAFVAVVYWKTRRQPSLSIAHDGVKKTANDMNYGYLNQRKSFSNEEQFYSGHPCPPINPGLDDISPYATFQIDPKKYHEETFSQEIVVAKFHPVMHGVPRDPRESRDKWRDRQMQDSDSDENTQRYSVIPPQRPRSQNLYQITPPKQPPPPLPYQYMTYQHRQTRDNAEDNSDSSSSDPSRTLEERRTMKKERDGRRNSGTKTKREKNHFQQKSEQPTSSATSLRRNKRKSKNSDYSIAV